MQGILASLSAEEQATLKLCGISQDAQLARTTVAALARDLQQCKQIFPSQACEIPAATLQRICDEARMQHSGTPAPADAPRRTAAPEKGAGLFFSRACPTLVVSGHHRNRSHTPGVTQARPLSATNDEIEQHLPKTPAAHTPADRQERIGAAAAYDYHNAVHNTHSAAVYLGAWATILFVLDVCAIIIIPLLIILGFEIPIDIRGVGIGVAIAAAVPYLCLNSHAICSVCRIGIFSFKKYSHNRQAHWMPLLGCALPTALHVAFRFWFRCPACGTPQKLFRRSRHRH